MNDVVVAMLMPLQRSDLCTLLQHGDNTTTVQAPTFVHYSTRCSLCPVGLSFIASAPAGAALGSSPSSGALISQMNCRICIARYKRRCQWVLLLILDMSMMMSLIQP
ncbi:Hypothetical predicted protein [Olea europaea subsp. europaea]|uniref:Uncharacterized protein n=1 Tax=Olea europaea subsp. europaea TaxID=158383 RepID=A0A8S0SQM1_OLEEU|nr:Hypothetical predicted protein [Olea europaea subsp. europaea]